MKPTERFKRALHSAKYASYNAPSSDIYAAQSVAAPTEFKIPKKDLATGVAGLVGGGAAYQLSKPFADTNLPLSRQKFRGAAILGTGIYAAKKARDTINKHGLYKENG